MVHYHNVGITEGTRVTTQQGRDVHNILAVSLRFGILCETVIL